MYPSSILTVAGAVVDLNHIPSCLFIFNFVLPIFIIVYTTILSIIYMAVSFIALNTIFINKKKPNQIF